jgi:hypothetical protein
MRVNISINPRKEVPYDLHLPIPIIVSPRSDKKINATQAQILETFSGIDHSTELVIVDNGGPPSYAERAADTLIRHGYQNVSVDQNYDYEYFNRPCGLFPDPKKPYFFFDIAPVKKDIEEFIEFYQSRIWEIEEPTHGVTGHYYRDVMLWTQVQMASDLSKTKNPELMSRLHSLIPKMHQFLKEVCESKGVDLTGFEKRLTIRIVDYRWHPEMNSILDTHIDGSMMTAVLYESEPGLHVRDYLDDTYMLKKSEPVEIGHRLMASEGVIFPGNTFSEELRMWAPACWHQVQLDNSTKRRTSFLVRLESVDF